MNRKLKIKTNNFDMGTKLPAEEKAKLTNTKIVLRFSLRALTTRGNTESKAKARNFVFRSHPLQTMSPNQKFKSTSVDFLLTSPQNACAVPAELESKKELPGVSIHAGLG